MKKRKKTAASKLINMITGELQGVASKLFASGKYKEAQEIYKILLKREDNAENRKGLAQCYLQRAVASAERKIFEEAIVLWENHAQFCAKPEYIELYLGWLVKCNQSGKIKDYLANLSTEQLHEEYPELTVFLGFLYVSGMLDLQQILPEDTLLIEQGNTALLALSAYAEHDRVRLDQQLKKIPFRSVYRDFCVLLKAAIATKDSAAQAQQLLNNIPAKSPYHHAAKLLLIMGQTGEELLASLLTLEHKQQLLVCEVKDWSKQQIKLLQNLNKYGDKITDKIKFDLAINYQGLLGTEFTQRFCYALLPTYPEGTRNYEKNFTQLNTFEKLRIAAQGAEARDEPYEAIEYWEQCLEFLLADTDKNALQIAQILRRIADISFLQGGDIESAIESLQYDPEDRETYAKIISCYQQDEEQDEVKRWLEKAIQKFPEDVDFLTQAMLSAKNKKAFKKATQFARKILIIDKVNTQAKDILFHSHLAHARRLLKTKKFHLVDKEIKQAENLNLGKHYPALAKLLYGFFSYADDDKKTGAQIIEKSLIQLGEGDFIARYRLINEALLLALPLPPLLHLFPPIDQDYIISAVEMGAFIKLLELQHKEDNKFINKTLDKLAKELKRSIRDKHFSSDIIFQLCQCLDRTKHFELLRYCVKIAHKRWSEPRWTFYKIYVDVKGDPEKLQFLQLSSLQIQFAAAKGRGDSRTAALISKFIDKYYAVGEAQTYVPDDLDDDPYEVLFDSIDEKIIDKIIREGKKMRSKLSADKFTRLATDQLREAKHVALLANDPGMFTTLLLLRAAQNLGVDIGYDVDDVIAIAESISKPSLPYPF